MVLKKCRVLCGIGIVENSRDETALIEAVAPQDFFVREAALLRKAREWLPRLPFTDCDLLIVGAKGHGGLADRVLGGVSYRVAHRARQPVVVVPPDWSPVS